MKMKTVMLLAVALTCGLVAMLGVQQALSGGRKGSGETVSVLVATTDIIPGIELDEKNVKFKEWPKDAVPSGAVTTREEYQNRALKVAAVTGEVVLQAKLGEQGVFGPSAEIPEGMRVATIAVNLTKTHSGLIRPGDRVDVLVTRKRRDNNRGTTSETSVVLEYIKVFAIDSVRAGSTTDGGQEINAKNVSVVVDPKQGALLYQAESVGQLHLSLRRPGDDSESGNVAVDESNLGGVASRGQADPEKVDPVFLKEEPDVTAFLEQEQKPEPAPPVETVAEPARPTWKIEIFSGEARRVEEVDLPETEDGTDAQQVSVRNIQKKKVGAVKSNAVSQPTAEFNGMKTAEAAGQTGDVESVEGGQLKSMLKSFFGGEKSAGLDALK